jgi:hypothetical protein
MTLDDQLAAARDRLARRYVRDFARIQGHLPPHHWVNRADDFDAELIIYTDHDPVGQLLGVSEGPRTMLGIPARRAAYAVSDDGEYTVELDMSDHAAPHIGAIYHAGHRVTTISLGPHTGQG